MPESFFLGVYWISSRGLWVSKGTVDGRVQEFAAGNNQSELASKTREIVKNWRLRGEKVCSEYGSLKQKKHLKIKCDTAYDGIYERDDGGFLGLGFVNGERVFLGYDMDVQKCAAIVRYKVKQLKASGAVAGSAYGELKKRTINQVNFFLH